MALNSPPGNRTNCKLFTICKNTDRWAKLQESTYIHFISSHIIYPMRAYGLFLIIFHKICNTRSDDLLRVSYSLYCNWVCNWVFETVQIRLISYEISHTHRTGCTDCIEKLVFYPLKPIHISGERGADKLICYFNGLRGQFFPAGNSFPQAILSRRKIVK